MVTGLAALLCVLAYVYAVHLDRPIAFDELALHNPAYMLAATGQVTYPVHGQPTSMTVQPPTHSLVVGGLLRLDLPVLTAAAWPVVLAFGALALVVVLGRFALGTASAVLLGAFGALFVWSEQYLVRPDNVLTLTWLLGVTTVQAARNRDWDPRWLFVGGAAIALAGTLHYWGFAGAVAALVGGALLLGFDAGWRTRRARLGLTALLGGGALVLVVFVELWALPLYDPIMARLDAVSRGGSDPFARHLASYAVFRDRLTWDIDLRWLTSAALWPPLTRSIPLVVLAVPLLLVWRDLRVIAACGAWLPLFVLLGSRDKQIGYTGYFTPEVALYLVGWLALLTAGIPALVARVRPALCRPVALAAAGVAAVAIILQVPVSSGHTLELRARGDVLELARAASQRVIGPDALLGIYSAGVWYTSGARDQWLALEELRRTGRDRQPIAAALDGVDALVVDTTWWHSRPDLAPVPAWFLDGQLQLGGFVLGTTGPLRELMMLFVTAQSRPPRGLLLGAERADELVPDPAGDTAVAVLQCRRRVEVPPVSGLSHASLFTYDAAPGPDVAHMAVVAAETAALPELRAALSATCRERQVITGSLRPVALDDLRAALRRDDRPIRFYASRTAAIEARGRDATGRGGAAR
jgi:hypothetical protein